MSTTAPEYLTTLRDGWADAMQQWLDQSTSVWDQGSQAWAGAMPRVAAPPKGATSRHRHGHGWGEGACGCRDSEHGMAPSQGRHHRHHLDDCGCCGDACDCCVPEADVIVHARAGEVRIVPFRLTNHWRREREVTLAVGPWHPCSGERLEIRSVLEEDKLVLAPCEDRVVRLLVSVRGRSGDEETDQGDERDRTVEATKAADSTAGASDAAAFVTAMTQGRRAADVEGCASAYADVRFEGCARPQRVAVVVSPGDCDAVDVCCDCGCC